MVTQESSLSSDKRKYKRLPTALPVCVRPVRLQNQVLGLDQLDGTTQNVSKGGICLDLSDLGEASLKYLKEHGIYLELLIIMPLQGRAVRAVAEVAWYELSEENERDVRIGFKFHSIPPEELHRLLGQVRWFHAIRKAVIILAVVAFALILSWSFLQHMQSSSALPSPGVEEKP